ncbi:hypothetical protein JKG47_00970 [Acidithiobacillus sp. MC6.1]|nr:hypothetical protein [Acidithiobacillus sp. MC6.1]
MPRPLSRHQTAQWDRLQDILAQHTRRDLLFLQAVERAVEHALHHRYPHAQVFCRPMAQSGYRVDVYTPAATGFRELQPRVWSSILDVSVLTDCLAHLPIDSGLDARIFLVRVAGCKGSDLLLTTDSALFGAEFKAPDSLMILPQSYLAFLDTAELLAAGSFFVSRYAGSSASAAQFRHPMVTRSHSFFLRDLAGFAGVKTLSCVINAASGLLISTQRPTTDVLRWVAAQARLRALHWAPPLPEGCDSLSATQMAVRIFTHLRLPKQRIRVLGEDPAHGQVVIYAPNDRARATLVGPWGGTIRLLSRYLGMPVRILPDEEMPWF